jgi:hypothetical protein
LKTFEFLTDRLPFGYAYNFDNYLFNKIRHISTQGIDNRSDYFIVNNIKKRIEGKIHFLVKEKVAYSPYKSLFGSFEFSPRIHPNLLGEFWQYIESDLLTKGAEKVKVIHHAECYAPAKAALVRKTLEQAGFSVKLAATNHHIEVDDDPLDSIMHKMQLRRLKKCRKLEFTFQEEESGRAEEIYDFLTLCRKEQGLEPSILKTQFLHYLGEFPQSYLLFSIRDDHELLAATIAIKVHRNILYNFLPGSLRKYSQNSPTVMLNEGLYNYCQQHHIELLDLGISTLKDGTEQESLAQFKERLGAKRSEKCFYEKDL